MPIGLSKALKSSLTNDEDFDHAALYHRDWQHNLIMKKHLRRIRRHLRALVGQDYFETTDLSCPTQTIGNAGANWTINPESIFKDMIVYSFGIGEDISFDLAMIEEYGLTVHAFDPTPKSLSWLEQQKLPPEFIVHPVGISDKEGILEFYPPANESWVSHSLIDNQSGRDPIQVPVKSLPTLMDELNHKSINILKMDIEGAEYAVIDALVRSSIRPDMLLVEFHHRFPGRNISHTQKAIASLRTADYQVFHVSDNGEEISLQHNPPN